MTSPRPYDSDPAKERENRRKHGVDFDAGYRVLTQAPEYCLDLEDARKEYGEDRLIRIGPHPEVPSLVLSITYVWRGDRPRLISVRPATSAERRRHANRYRKSR